MTSTERGQVNKEEEQEEEDSHIDNEDCYMRAHPICSASALSQQELLNKIKSAYNWCRLDGWLNLTASTFNRLGPFASTPGNRANCHAELAYRI